MTAHPVSAVARKFEEPRAHALVELDVSRSKWLAAPAPARRARPTSTGTSSRSVRSGERPPVAIAFAVDERAAEAAAVALVGQRRGGEAVADDDGAGFERRADDVATRWARAASKSRSSLSGPPTRPRARTMSRMRSPRSRAAGLARVDHLVAGGAESLGEGAAWTADLPAPSPPSRTMKRPRAVVSFMRALLRDERPLSIG